MPEASAVGDSSGRSSTLGPAESQDSFRLVPLNRYLARRHRERAVLQGVRRQLMENQCEVLGSRRHQRNIHTVNGYLTGEGDQFTLDNTGKSHLAGCEEQ